MGGIKDLFSTSKTTSESGDVDWKNRGLDLFGEVGITNSLKDRLNAGYDKYTGDRYNDLSDDQTAAMDFYRNNVSNIPGREIFESAIWGNKNVPGISVDPVTGQTVGTGAFGDMGGNNLQGAGRARIQDLVAGQFAGTDLAPYMNPFTNQVIDTNMQDINRIADLRTQAANSRATQAGAYGGDRASIERGMIDEEAIRTGGQMAAQLRARGFDAAADLVTKDLNRSLDADSSNQLADRQTVSDSMAIAADVQKATQAQNRAAQTDVARNQLQAARQLQDAFGIGTDAWRNYLGDYTSRADTEAALAERDNEFEFAEFLRSSGYDQSMIENMINLFGRAPEDKSTEETMDRGLAGDFASAVSIYDDAKGFADWIKGWGDDDDAWFS